MGGRAGRIGRGADDPMSPKSGRATAPSDLFFGCPQIRVNPRDLHHAQQAQGTTTGERSGSATISLVQKRHSRPVSKRLLDLSVYTLPDSIDATLYNKEIYCLCN